MKKNIIIVVSAMNMGGAQRVVSILSDHWSRNGNVVTLICTFTGEKDSHFEINNNVSISYLSDSPIFSKIKLWNLLWKLFQLRSEIKRKNPDLVISFLARVNVASALSTIGLKFPLILCERTWPPFSSLNSNLLWIYKILFKRANKFIVQTEESKRWLKKNFKNNNVKVIPNPTLYPLPSEKEGSIKPDSIVLNNKKIILASGRLHKVKQFDLLIYAFSQIKDEFPDWDLIILGDGEERDFLKKIIQELSISDRVFFPGRVGNISEWYKRADLFVLSSKVEGFPNVLLEAMSYGVPSVSFDCDTGPRDIIEDGVNGILVNPAENEAGLGKALKKMVSNNNFRSSVAKKAVLVRDRFSINKIMSEWDDALDQKESSIE